MKLNNQIEIPELGLGVFQIPNDETADVVKNAIVNGYRLIDTAKIYENEEGTGQGIQNFGEIIILMKKQFKTLKKV